MYLTGIEPSTLRIMGSSIQLGRQFRASSSGHPDLVVLPVLQEKCPLPVVIGCGLTPVKILFRLRLQKICPRRMSTTTCKGTAHGLTPKMNIYTKFNKKIYISNFLQYIYIYIIFSQNILKYQFWI
jgi:hypothetical protein